MLVIVCVEVLLVFDHIFWYGDRRIKEQHIQAALLCYLNISPRVLTKLNKRLDTTNNILEIGLVLSNIIDTYYYCRDRKLGNCLTRTLKN
jgi:hypothetical protein